MTEEDDKWWLPKPGEGFSYRDGPHKLSTLACYVAGHFDGLFRGKIEKVDEEEIERLVNYLKTDVIKGAVTRSLGGNTALMILGYSLREVFPEGDVRNIDDVVYRSSLAVQEMSRFRELPKERLEAMRNYCVVLSKTARGCVDPPDARFLAA